ncbi:unnamed protein product [Cyclocybe aegerita]|uniref:Uncharacterized protein n=1 Tax=Cyclocybe aegerita TaxID=1973307 RepID=A0A8S0WBF4_CYCAE|nr:unnamed protein product [Cyclocybe aegerita]
MLPPKHQLALSILANPCFFLPVHAARLVAVEALLPSPAAAGSSGTNYDTTTPEARATASEVVNDKFFIPAIVTMGVFVALIVVCLYKIGWCFNRKQRDKAYERTAYPVPAHLQPQPDPAIPRPVSLNMDGGNTWNKRQSALQRKSPPTVYGNLPPPSRLATTERQPTISEYSTQPPGAFQPRPSAPQVAMSVQRTAPPAQDSGRGYWNQGARMSTFSADQSSTTQLGSGDPSSPPTNYQPYPGYAPSQSYTAQSQPYPSQSQRYPTQPQGQSYGGQNPQYPTQTYPNAAQNPPNNSAYSPPALSYASSSPSSNSPSEKRQHQPHPNVTDSFYGPSHPQQAQYGYGVGDQKRSEGQWSGEKARMTDGSDGGRPAYANPNAEASSSMEPPGYRTDGVPTAWYRDQKSGLKAALG